MTATLTSEPRPKLLLSDRWRPTRAGLVGLWRYWDETFAFHHGRLLLRGPNGSGKSMALELLLPFLLDGDASPARLTSAAKSRGRLFDRVMTGSDEPSRTGFAWVEFRRGDEVFTVGARIRASRSTNKADVDLFTTTLAVGGGLCLLDVSRTPISRKALAETIGSTGRVHASAEEHRTAVRETLFPGFSGDRYASVVSALLALRKEKLSQNLDLEKLSAVLSDALPPLDDHDIASVAEGFERLDRRRAELAMLERDLAEVRQLARQQRDYACAVIVGAAGQVRGAASARDAATRAERDATESLDRAQSRADAVAEERRALDDRHAEIGVQTDALKDSDAYRAGAGLADLRAQATRLREIAARAARTADERDAEHTTARDEKAGAVADHDTASGNVELARSDLDRAAATLAAEGVVAEAAGIAAPDDAQRFVGAWTQAQRQRIHEVRSALATHSRAVSQREFFDRQVADDEATVDNRLAAQLAASRSVDTELDAYAAAIEEWSGECSSVPAGELAAALTGNRKPDEVAAAIARLESALRAQEATSRQVIATKRSDAQQERSALAAERSRWADDALVDPDGPPWRSSRAGRAGAPLWRLVDVRPEVAGRRLDGVEAALTAAGLLDAWVSPSGAVDLGAEVSDVALTARPASSQTLASVLEPAPGADVSGEIVAAVLASIPIVDTALGGDSDGDSGGGVAIGIDGTYRLGAAVGRGPLRPGRLLGAVARERHRLARLAELDTAIAQIEASLASLDRDDAGLDRLRDAIDAELAARPAGDGVREAERGAAQADVRLDEARNRLDATRAARRTAEDAVRAALRELTSLAARHNLPADGQALTDIETALGRLADATTTWVRRRREHTTARRDLERATAREDSAARASARASEDRHAADQEATGCEQRVATLEISVGAEYAEIVARIGALGAERTANRRQAEHLSAEERELLVRLGEFRGQVSEAASARELAEAERERSHRRLVAALGALSADAGINVTEHLDTATGVLAAARAIAADHDHVDASEQAVERISERVRERVHSTQAAMGARIDVDREYDDEGWWVVRTSTGGLRRGIGELVTALSGELDQGRAELAADEEALFEQTLAGSVRRALADRIRQANALVDGINAQLAAVRTAAAGVQVRLRWDVDADQPAAVKAARALLLRDPADLSDTERRALQEFVRARVDQARAELEANAPWEARLRESLDYRAWHRFVLQVAHRDWDGFQPATANRLRRLSTGERSIALHLPMIASVAAHYADGDGAPSGCPRLILLDELFAGVDTANRAQLFGTFTTWQLDAVFTSDHEWCQYADLDGIAIHHLHPPSGNEPVTSTRFTWDGRRRLLDPAT